MPRPTRPPPRPVQTVHTCPDLVSTPRLLNPLAVQTVHTSCSVSRVRMACRSVLSLPSMHLGVDGVDRWTSLLPKAFFCPDLGKEVWAGLDTGWSSCK